LFVALVVVVFTYVIRRERRRRSGLAALAARLGLSYQRHADPWSIAGPHAEVDEVVYGWLDGVPVALLTLTRWVGTGSYGEVTRSRQAWSLAAVPIAAPVDPAALTSLADFPVRLDVRSGWLLIARHRQGLRMLYSPAGTDEAERLLRLAVRLGHTVPIRQPTA
jgi:hypothetical protein